MHKINWGRVVICGLGAALAWSALSDAPPGDSWQGADRGRASRADSRTRARGGWLYAQRGGRHLGDVAVSTLRPRYGTGLKTAAIVGLSWWLIGSVFTAHWAAFGFIRFRDVIALMMTSLPVLIGVTVLASRAYQDKPGNEPVVVGFSGARPSP